MNYFIVLKISFILPHQNMFYEIEFIQYIFLHTFFYQLRVPLTIFLPIDIDIF